MPVGERKRTPRSDSALRAGKLGGVKAQIDANLPYNSGIEILMRAKQGQFGGALRETHRYDRVPVRAAMLLMGLELAAALGQPRAKCPAFHAFLQQSAC